MTRNKVNSPNKSRNQPWFRGDPRALQRESVTMIFFPFTAVALWHLLAWATCQAFLTPTPISPRSFRTNRQIGSGGLREILSTGSSISRIYVEPDKLPGSLDIVMGTFLPKKKKQSTMESSIQAALVLTDKKRQEEWKKDISKKFPLIPAFVIDICMDSIVEAFGAVAPNELKIALKPGGLEKV